MNRNDMQDFEQFPADATLSYVAVYDPTMPGYTRRMVKECYMLRGRDVTQEVIANHTTLLLEVLALETTIALLERRPAARDNEYTLDYMKHHLLPRAKCRLEDYENNFTGIKQYRQFRTPFTKN